MFDVCGVEPAAVTRERHFMWWFTDSVCPDEHHREHESHVKSLSWKPQSHEATEAFCGSHKFKSSVILTRVSTSERSRVMLILHCGGGLWSVRPLANSVDLFTWRKNGCLIIIESGHNSNGKHYQRHKRSNKPSELQIFTGSNIMTPETSRCAYVCLVAGS